MSRAYYLLLERADASQPYCIEFGSYDRADVVSERLDRRDHDIRASNLRIVKCPSDDSASIAKFVADLNAAMN